MMPVWTVFRIDVECGCAQGRHLIPAGHPVHVIAGAVRRCLEHSAVSVDWDAVEAARVALEARPIPANPSSVTRVRPVRSPAPFHAISALALPFDARAAAAGESEDA